MLGQPYLDVLLWEPEDVATALEWQEAQQEAADDARRKG